jgi:Asp-tRNA(Asn)/Glu-tRNA(Gln) amidotransferase A subunit family amidase
MYLERIARLGPALNAFWLTTPELARSQARQLPDGPLAGACTSIKDLAAMAGFPLTFGSRAFDAQVAQSDSFAVSRIKAAGCPILGRTTTPELGSRPVTEFGLHGVTRNPWSLSHTSGGSSGGAAAALAAGLCAWSHGTDGGGSVRIPASCCGVVGLKPSRGRVSLGPLVGEGWAGLSTQGVLTRTAEDAGRGARRNRGPPARRPLLGRFRRLLPGRGPARTGASPDRRPGLGGHPGSSRARRPGRRDRWPAGGPRPPGGGGGTGHPPLQKGSGDHRGRGDGQL